MGALLYYLNLPRPDTAVSHLGRTLELVRSDGLAELWNIAWRKMDMNFRLVLYSLWAGSCFSLFSGNFSLLLSGWALKKDI